MNIRIGNDIKIKFTIRGPYGFDKVNVNGDEASILYTYLKKHQKGFFGKKIKWNFTKFLIDRKGNVVKRYSPNVKPFKISKDIEKLLRRKV